MADKLKQSDKDDSLPKGVNVQKPGLKKAGGFLKMHNMKAGASANPEGVTAITANLSINK